MFHRFKIAVLRTIAKVSGSAHLQAQKRAYHLGYTGARKPARPVPGYELAYFNGRKHALDQVPPLTTPIDEPYVSRDEQRQINVERALALLIKKFNALESRSNPGILLEHQSPVVDVAPQRSSVSAQADPKVDPEQFVLTFGKQAGKTIGSCPTGYLRGLLKSERLEPQIRGYIEAVLDARGVSTKSAARPSEDKKQAEHAVIPLPNDAPPADFDEIPVDDI